MKTKLILSTLLLAAIVSCKKDDPVTPVVPNEEEVITTLNYTLTNTSDATDVVVLTWEDEDGDGSGPAVITGGILKSSATYSGSMELLNKTETPADTVTLEILEEDDEHQFFFQSTTMTVNYSDLDENMKPVGLLTQLETAASTLDTLKVTLIHTPDKTATGVSGGDITNAGGSVDVEVSFPITIED
jgi:hypothetical protein